MVTIKYEDYSKRIDEVMSFYQSKRAMLRKQVTHWIGKFMIVKAENNRLRQKIKRAETCIKELAAENLRANTKNKQLQDFVATVSSFSGDAKFIEVVGVGEVQKLEKTVHEKEPCKC